MEFAAFQTKVPVPPGKCYSNAFHTYSEESA